MKNFTQRKEGFHIAMILRHFNENNTNEWEHSSLRVRDDTGDWDLYDMFCGQAEENIAVR